MCIANNGSDLELAVIVGSAVDLQRVSEAFLGPIAADFAAYFGMRHRRWLPRDVMRIGFTTGLGCNVCSGRPVLVVGQSKVFKIVIKRLSTAVEIIDIVVLV